MKATSKIVIVVGVINGDGGGLVNLNGSQLTSVISGNGAGLTNLINLNTSQLTGVVPQASLGDSGSYTPAIGNGTANFLNYLQNDYYAKMGNRSTSRLGFNGRTRARPRAVI